MLETLPTVFDVNFQHLRAITDEQVEAAVALIKATIVENANLRADFTAANNVIDHLEGAEKRPFWIRSDDIVTAQQLVDAGAMLVKDETEKFAEWRLFKDRVPSQGAYEIIYCWNAFSQFKQDEFGKAWEEWNGRSDDDRITRVVYDDPSITQVTIREWAEIGRASAAADIEREAAIEKARQWEISDEELTKLSVQRYEYDGTILYIVAQPKIDITNVWRRDTLIGGGLSKLARFMAAFPARYNAHFFCEASIREWKENIVGVAAPVAAKPTAIEFTTLTQQWPVHGRKSKESDAELSEFVNQGFSVVDISVNYQFDPEGPDYVNRIVTLSREVKS